MESVSVWEQHYVVKRSSKVNMLKQEIRATMWARIQEIDCLGSKQPDKEDMSEGI